MQEYATPMLDDIVEFLLANEMADQDDIPAAYEMAEELAYAGINLASAN